MAKIDHEKLNKQRKAIPVPEPWWTRGKTVTLHLKANALGGTKCGYPCSDWKVVEDIEKVTCKICKWLHNNPGKESKYTYGDYKPKPKSKPKKSGRKHRRRKKRKKK
jgi:hypothetical protein